MKKSEEIEETCKKLKPVIGDKAQNLWYMYLAEDEKNRKDLTLDIEIIAEKLLKKEALEQKTILLEPPSLYDSLGFFTVGNVVYNNKTLHKLSLSPEDFIKQIGIFAVTGEGKTNLAFLLALELLNMGIPFLAIDWKRSWRGLLSLKESIPNLKKLQVYTIGRDVARFPWNPLRPPPGVHYKSWLGVVTEVIEKSHLGGAGVADFFLRIFEKKFKELGFNDGKEKDFYPNFFDGKAELDGMRVYARELLWKQSTARIFRDFTFGPAAKSFNARNPVKLEELLDKPVILELDLEMPKSLRTFFTEIILRWIHLYRLGQGETDELRNVLFLEEVHNLFPKNRIERETSNSLENVYREIRAFGQGLVSITQHPSMLPIYILGNSHTQIFLGLQHEDDIRAARKSLFLDGVESSVICMLEDFLNKQGAFERNFFKRSSLPPRGCWEEFYQGVRGWEGFNLMIDDFMTLQRGPIVASYSGEGVTAIVKEILGSTHYKDNIGKQTIRRVFGDCRAESWRNIAHAPKSEEVAENLRVLRKYNMIE